MGGGYPGSQRAMSERHAIGMVLLSRGERAQRALEGLAGVLPGAEVTGPDPQDGTFEVRLDASGREDALTQVWNAVAAAGVDDHVAILEHPDLPEHWRRRSQPAGVAGAEG
jgi:hypothetical protein